MADRTAQAGKSPKQEPRLGTDKSNDRSVDSASETLDRYTKRHKLELAAATLPKVVGVGTTVALAASKINPLLAHEAGKVAAAPLKAAFRQAQTVVDNAELLDRALNRKNPSLPEAAKVENKKTVDTSHNNIGSTVAEEMQQEMMKPYIEGLDNYLHAAAKISNAGLRVGAAMGLVPSPVVDAAVLATKESLSQLEKVKDAIKGNFGEGALRPEPKEENP